MQTEFVNNKSMKNVLSLPYFKVPASVDLYEKGKRGYHECQTYFTYNCSLYFKSTTVSHVHHYDGYVINIFIKTIKTTIFITDMQNDVVCAIISSTILIFFFVLK